MKKEFTYLVPFSHIPCGSRILIYGGGKLGKIYYRKIRLNRWAEIVAVIDAQAENLQEAFGETPTYGPDKICELCFDYVLIAVENMKSADEIRQLLYDYNVPAKKIVWNPEKYCVNEGILYEIMKCFERNIETENRRFFLFMLPEHGNLGDYAIGAAESAFLKRYFDQYEIYGITTSEWLAASEFYVKLIKQNDVIFINGGGFLGDLWGDARIYMHIIESFPQNVKIFFPNTLTYLEKPDKENKIFMKDMEWFGKQKKLFTFFREKFSYQLFRQYDKRCGLFPDMAFYLCCDRKEFYKKSKVLLCMRNDREKIFRGTERLEYHLKCAGFHYDRYDINLEKYISQQEGQKLLQHTMQLFQSYDCVITDRLHGMILAAVSNVACIAFDNRTHKIRGVFEFIKNLQYVRLIEEDEIYRISHIISKLNENQRKTSPYCPPAKEFEKMAGKICEFIDHAI